MENNERSTAPPASTPYDTSHIRRDGAWRGDELWLRDRVVASIVRDDKYPQMWRVKLPDGTLSDMVNRVRAKEAAYYLA